MRPKRQREVWSALGRDDADWSVLTVRQRRHGGWDGDLDSFYASGRDVVDECLVAAPPPAYAKVLDYGAGTGRLSLALAARFDAVTALDVSPGMLTTLRARAEQRHVDNVEAVEVDDFAPAGDHDFALSLLVLQHLADHTQVLRALELVGAALRPGGTAVIELPERALLLRARLQPRLRVYTVLRGIGVPAGRLHRWGFSGISMLTVDDARARALFDRAGLEVLGRLERPDRDFHYVRWLLRRRSTTGGGG